MKRFLLFFLLTLMAVTVLRAQVYLCGSVNNWDIQNVLAFTRNNDGVYTLKVNFATGANTEFKLSTVRPAGSDTNSAWNEFDRGVLGFEGGAIEADKWLQLKQGVATNIKAPAASEYTLMVDLATYRLMFSTGEVGPTPSDGDWSGTLPVLFINTNDNLPVDSKEEYRKGTYYLDPMGVQGIDAIGSAAQPLTLQIKGRGNYTWTGFDKKPYRLKLDAKAPLMGMKTSKHFALLAHADDNLGYMRNVMGFALSRKLGLPWTPATKPIEVVLNGNYIGLYWLTETIRVDGDRVNVVEQEDRAITDVDGGWLVEIDNYDTDPHVTVNTSDGYPIWFTYKSPEVLSTEQENYLQSQMTAINSAVQAGDFAKLSQLVDIDCLARYYIVQQLMQDRESFHGSCYLNRQRGESNKWMFGPVWDFGNAFGDNTGENPGFIDGTLFYQVWIPKVYRMPGFLEAVKSVWSTFADGGCSDVISEMKPVAESIVDAAKADAARWPQYAQTDIMTKYNRISTYLRNSNSWAVEQWGQGVVAEQHLYLCGTLNGWAINNLMEFSRNSDGIYSLKANFAADSEFKISTVRPTGQGNGAWNEFDSGVLGISSPVEANKWLQLTPGLVTNIKAPSAGEYTLMVDLATNRLMFSTGSVDPNPSDGDWSGTLPVLFINTNDNLPVDSKEVYRKGTYYLDPMGVQGIEAIGSAAEPLTLQIKGRGNYTWTGFDKKPYRLKLDAKAALMGMKKSKHFAILAHADDNLGHLRNEMGFALSRKLGLPWTPDAKPIEVVLNGDYIGLYWLTETIRVDGDRVNVVEQEDLATTDVDGGWLVEIDNYDTDPHVTVNTSDGYPIWFTYKSPEVLSTEQENYLQSQMTAINSAVQAGDFAKLSQLVDIDCLARYYIVQQLMQDRESFHGSCYLNRERDESSKWMFGPVWDFGNAFGDNTGENPGFIDGTLFYQVWIPKIYRMPEFQKAVKSVWQTFASDGCETIIEGLKPVAESIVDAAKADAARWPQYAQTDIMTKYNRICTYLRNSNRWSTEQWGQAVITEQHLYLCGTLNGWAINNLMEFNRNSDGIFYLKANFAADSEFKISTVRPTGQGNGAWNEFDSGALGISSPVEANKWLSLTPGLITNIKAPAAGEFTVYVDLANNTLMFSNGGEGPTPSHAWSGTLPVIFINTTDNLPVDSKEVYRKGTYYLDPMGVEDVEPVGSEAEPLTLQIKGRGNWTWVGFDKKPYRLKLDAKAALLGMKKSKHFALLAHADDNLGFLRNVMGFALSRKIDLPWTPDAKPVEVVLNGDYIGLYWLTETIRVDSDRVNVVEQEDLATTDVDGGWLVEIDNYDTDPHVTVNTSDGYPIWFTYKSPEVLSSEQENYLQAQMEAINRAVDAGDFESLYDLVDIDCLARYYIVQQMMQDRESFHGSCYLNRQRGEMNRWKFGPVWDFGNAFMDGTGTNPVFIGNSDFYQVWISKIYNMPEFITTIKGIWEDFGPDGCNEVIHEIRPVAESIEDAAKADAARWPQYGQTDIIDKYDLISSYLRNSHDWGIREWGKVGVSDVDTDASAPVRYFNLQGVELHSPSAGSVVIRLQGTMADKIVVTE